MNPPPPPFTVGPSTYTGEVYPGGESVGISDATFTGFQGLNPGEVGLRIDGDPADSGYPAWWEWALPEPLPAGAYLSFDLQWWASANFVVMELLGDGVQIPDGAASFGPRSYYASGWWPIDLRGMPLPAGITTLRCQWSGGESDPTTGYAISVLFRNLAIFVDTPAVPFGGETYIAGDVVRHNGATWLAVEMAFPGDEPGASPAWVQVAKDGLSYQGDWA